MNLEQELLERELGLNNINDALGVGSLTLSQFSSSARSSMVK